MSVYAMFFIFCYKRLSVDKYNEHLGTKDVKVPGLINKNTLK